MSLSTDLTTKSKVFTWLESHCNLSAVDKIIGQHNYYLRTSPRIKPVGTIDFALVGMAFTYGFRDWLYPLTSSIEQTVAWTGARRIGCCELLLQALTEHERTSLLYILLAILDGIGRGKDIPDYLYKALGVVGKFLPAALTPILDESLVEDLNKLLFSIDSAWAGNIGLVSQKSKYHCNPSFAGSHLVKGADAQIILDGCLIDVRTTLKSHPFSKENFFQQIAYTLLDFTDQYKIHTLVWYYSRQQAVFHYPVAKLFHALQEKRSEFRDYLEAFREPSIDELDFEDDCTWYLPV